MIKTYSELKKLTTFEERFNYLRFTKLVGELTFGYDRYLNQHLYRSTIWRRIRDQVIIRDEACDLGIEGYDIFDRIIVHHMNPLTIEQIENGSPDILDDNLLICTTHKTHLAIHYGNNLPTSNLLPDRYPHDMIPWR